MIKENENPYYKYLAEEVPVLEIRDGEKHYQIFACGNIKGFSKKAQVSNFMPFLAFELARLSRLKVPNFPEIQRVPDDVAASDTADRCEMQLERRNTERRPD